MKSEIKRHKFKSGLTVEFEIQNLSDLYDKAKKLLIVPHRAEFYNIIWIKKGTLRLSVDFQPIILKENSIIFIPKESIKIFEEACDYEGSILIFTDGFFNKNINDIRYLQSNILFNDLRQIIPIEIPETSTDLELLFEAMCAELKNRNDASQAEILRNYLHNFLLIAERFKRGQGHTEMKSGTDLDYVLLFKDLLEKNYNRDKSVTKYVSDLGISEKRLYNATIKILDKSPKELIDERVLLEAKRLLSYSQQSVKEIAYELGFEEPTNFIKYFKKHALETPSEFRDRFR